MQYWNQSQLSDPRLSSLVVFNLRITLSGHSVCQTFHLGYACNWFSCRPLITLYACQSLKDKTEVWVLGVLSQDIRKKSFFIQESYRLLLSERDSTVKTFFNRIKLIRKFFRGTLQFPFSTIKNHKNVQMRF